MDNNLKSVPQRKLLRDDQKSSPAVYSQQIGGVWQSDRGMRGEMKAKHPCELEWYAKALRHLLVQYKESVRLVICQFLNKLHNPPTTTTKEDEAAFYFPPRETCSNPRTSRGWVPDLESEQTDKKSWPSDSEVVNDQFVCSLRRLQTGRRCPSFTAHAGWRWRNQKPLPWGEMVSHHALFMLREKRV